MTYEDLTKVLVDSGTYFKDAGQDLLIVCPNPDHKDSRPSCRIAKQKEVFHCFSCGFKGSYNKVARYVLGLNRNGFEDYCSDNGIDHTDFDLNIDEVCEEVGEYESYKYPLSKKAVSYLKSRGIGEEFQSKFQLGYDDEERVILIPIFMNGKFKGCQKRSIEGKSYTAGMGLKKERAIFNFDSSIKKRIVLVENPLCAVWLSQLGLHAEATLGSEVGEEQMKIIKKHNKFLIWFDNDIAGDNSRDHLIRSLFEGADVKYIDWSGGYRYPIKCSPDDLDLGEVKEFIKDHMKDSFDDMLNHLKANRR